MNKQTNKKIQEVKKPTLRGSFHGKDANKLIFRRFLAMLVLFFVFLISALVFSFEAFWLRTVCSCLVVAAAFFFTYSQGAAQGENDAGYGEIMYVRKQEGKAVSQDEQNRCFHPLKGFYAVLISALPFVAVAIFFACNTQLDVHTLGTLPSWTGALLEHNETGDALAYYSMNQHTLQYMDVLRIFVRGLIMPFVNIAVGLNNHAVLLVERLSPLLLLIAPLGYGVGYTQGVRMRIRINTSIQLGVEKKKRQQKRERKQRQRTARKPEQLI